MYVYTTTRYAINMTNEKDINKVFNFIETHYLFINLLSSISYSRYKLYDIIIALLKKFPKIIVNQSYQYTSISNIEVKKRLLHLHCLLLDSNNYSDDFVNYILYDYRRKGNKIAIFNTKNNIKE